MGRLFGTDGIRGIANQSLTREMAMEIGAAAAMVLSGINARRRPVFVIGSDTRISSDMLALSAAAGLCSVGADVIMLGENELAKNLVTLKDMDNGQQVELTPMMAAVHINTTLQSKKLAPPIKEKTKK